MGKIAVVGVGGRTGTMFASELGNSADVLGVGRKEDIERVREGKIYLEAGREKTIRFTGKTIEEEKFNEEIGPDFIFLCVKNPVGPAVNFYYRRVKKEKIPSLILSQNGVLAVEEAKKELEKIFGERAKEIRIIRVSLFNPISSEKIDDVIKISYFSPVRLAFGVAAGPKETKDIKEIFEKAKIEAEEVPAENIKNMEFSKLFTNLIGMASAVRGLSIKEGFENGETIGEEMEALREYIRVVKASKGKFLNFKHYPIKLITSLISFLPLSIVRIFRKKMAGMITKGRGGKEKGNIDEIEYYNGAVVKLGRNLGIKTPVNEKIYKRALENLGRI